MKTSSILDGRSGSTQLLSAVRIKYSRGWRTNPGVKDKDFSLFLEYELLWVTTYNGNTSHALQFQFTHVKIFRLDAGIDRSDRWIPRV